MVVVTLQRYIANDIKSLALKRSKMAFISGPRQVGKTTLALALGKSNDVSLYKNWDESTFRRIWTKSPNLIRDELNLSRSDISRCLILDEIHKAKGWKQKLKGLFDELGRDVQVIVTGSARLDVFKKGGDSLMGRYISFRLHPLSYNEVQNGKILDPEKWKSSLFKRSEQKYSQASIEQLMKLSGFPEPFFSKDEKIRNIWSRGRIEKIIREDLRDLSRLPELSQVEMLVSLLPSKVGSPLSVQSLREDLEVSFDTVKRWLNYLRELYYHFEIRPWSKAMTRSLKKEPKIYLFDWTEIDEAGPRFENFIASHLLKACHYWTDIGHGSFALHYLRNKEKQEIDFLVVKDRSPWLCVESKLSDSKIDGRVAKHYQSRLKIPFVQVIQESNHFWKSEDQVILSANRFLSGLP